MQLTFEVPDNLAQEVIDFVDFLKSKYVSSISNSEKVDEEDIYLSDLMISQSLSLRDRDNCDDEVWDHVPTH